MLSPYVHYPLLPAIILIYSFLWSGFQIKSVRLLLKANSKNGENKKKGKERKRQKRKPVGMPDK